MATIKIIFHALKSARLRAHLRSEFPLLALVPPFLLGQLVPEVTPSPPLSCLILFAVLPFLLLLLQKISLAVTTTALVLGLFSNLAAAPPVPQLPSSEASYIATVSDPIRQRRTNERELKLSLVGQLLPAGNSIFTAAPVERTGVLCKAAHLPWRNVTAVLPSDLVVLKASFRPVQRQTNPFAYKNTLLRRGITATCKIRYLSKLAEGNPGSDFRLRRMLIARVLETGGDNERSGLFLSMTIGVRDMISQDTEEAFKRTGLTHLLVFSGYQVTLLYCALLWLLRHLFARMARLFYFPCPTTMLASIAALCGSLAFVWLSGIEGSSLRAAWAIVFLVTAKCMERGAGLLNSILFSLLALSVIWPACILEPGIELTYAALLGICLGSSGESRHSLLTMLKVCLCASLCTSLVVLLWFDQFSIAGFLLNPVVAPAASLLTCKLGLIALALSTAGIDPAGYSLHAVLWLVALFRAFVMHCGQYALAAVVLEGSAKAEAAGALAAAVIIVVLIRMRNYLQDRNLAPWLPAEDTRLPGGLDSRTTTISVFSRGARAH